MEHITVRTLRADTLFQCPTSDKQSNGGSMNGNAMLSKCLTLLCPGRHRNGGTLNGMQCCLCASHYIRPSRHRNGGTRNGMHAVYVPHTTYVLAGT